MIIDVGSLTHRYGWLLVMHCMISTILHKRDVANRPLAYVKLTFFNNASGKLTPPLFEPSPTPTLSNGFITQTLAGYTVDA